MPFTPKDWHDGQAGGTPLDAAALEDEEQRVHDGSVTDAVQQSLAIFMRQPVRGNAMQSFPSLQIPVVYLHDEDPTTAIRTGLRRGYTFITVSELYDAYLGKRALPSKPAMLFYDDGHLLQFQTIHPIVQSLGVKATIAITSDFLNGLTVDSTLSTFLGGTPMTWANLTTMYQSGVWDIQNHTKTHTLLPTQTSAQRLADLAACNRDIVANVGCPAPVAVIYPQGQFDAGTLADLATGGFPLGFTTSNFLNDSREPTLFPSEGLRTINRVNRSTATWCDNSADDVFWTWERDSNGGINASNALGFWTVPTNGSFISGGAELKIDNSGTQAAREFTSADTFRVAPGGQMFYRFYLWSQAMTAGKMGLYLRQYSTRSKLQEPDLPVVEITTDTAKAWYEGEIALDPACRYVQIVFKVSSTFAGIAHLANGLIRPAHTRAASNDAAKDSRALVLPVGAPLPGVPSLAAFGSINQARGVRVRVPKSGYLRDVSVLVGTQSGNGIFGVYDTGDASNGNRSLLGASGTIAVPAAGAWMTWDPGATGIYVTQDQALDLVLLLDNATASVSKFAVASSGALALPSAYLPASGGASPKLGWTYSPGSFALPSTISEANCAANTVNPVWIIARIG